MLCVTSMSQAQSVKDAIEFFTIHVNKKAYARDSTLYPAKVIVAPVISYSPETSVALGVGAKYLFKMKGSGDETRTSNMPVSLRYTFENQFIIYSGFEVFTPQERWMLTGNLLYQKFPRLFYGIGRDTDEAAEEEYSFSQVLIEPILLKGVFFKHFFLGAGVRYNHISGAEYEPDGLLDLSGEAESTSAGVELAMVYDSRDNLLNAYSGLYVEFTHGFYGKVMNATHSFELTRLDLRYFVQPFKNKNDDVIATQLLLHFTHGAAPLIELAQFGMEGSMRGYYEGRYMDNHMVALQTEYRKKIYRRLGGVVFAGVGDVSDRVGNFEFNNLRWVVGGGLRFMLEKKERLNVRFDVGFGNKTNNYYLNIAEAF